MLDTIHTTRRTLLTAAAAAATMVGAEEDPIPIVDTHAGTK